MAQPPHDEAGLPSVTENWSVPEPETILTLLPCIQPTARVVESLEFRM